MAKQSKNKFKNKFTNCKFIRNSGHHRYRSDEAAKIIGNNFNLMPNPTKDENDSLLPPSKNEEENNLNAPINNNQSGEIQKRKNWRQLLNFDSLNNSTAQNDTKKLQQIMKVHYENLPVPPSPSGMSSASRSASAQNLVNLNSTPTTNIRTTTNLGSPNGSLKTTTMTAAGNVSKTISKVELTDRFRQSLENYGRFSFAVNVEYECMMRAVHLHIVTGQFIEVESFLREHTCRFLDDKFTVFNNIMKSNICLATAEVYNQV